MVWFRFNPQEAQRLNSYQNPNGQMTQDLNTTTDQKSHPKYWYLFFATSIRVRLELFLDLNYTKILKIFLKPLKKESNIDI